MRGDCKENAGFFVAGRALRKAQPSADGDVEADAAGIVFRKVVILDDKGVPQGLYME